MIFDEVLTQPNGDLWTAMRTGMGTRLEPLLLAATTAGDDPSSFAKTEHDECVKIADDSDRAPHRFVHLRNLPADADPWDETNWFLANPALGEDVAVAGLHGGRRGGLLHESDEGVGPGRPLTVAQILGDDTTAEALEVDLRRFAVDLLGLYRGALRSLREIAVWMRG